MDSRFFRKYANIISEADSDPRGQRCKRCRKGTYQETSVQDDWQGVLHCNKCGDKISTRDAPKPVQQPSEVSSDQAYEWVKTGHWDKRAFLSWLDDKLQAQWERGRNEGQFDDGLPDLRD